MSQPLGALLPHVGDQLGLAPGTPVFASPGDQPAAVLGTGAAVRGDAAINLGTSFLTSFPLGAIETALAKGGSVSCTLEVLSDDTYAVELGGGAGTNVLDWLRTALFDLPSVEALNALAESSVPGAHGITVLPNWWSALGGTSGLIKGLRATHSRADIARATLEGLAYEVRWAWDRLAEAADAVPGSVALFGGASQHDLLCQTLADVLQRPTYRTATPEASALGAAIGAATGSGWFGSVQEAASHMAHSGRRFEPQAGSAEFFEDSYADYLALRAESAR
jgi:sugar (pentulose or hexulose) kinase